MLVLNEDESFSLQANFEAPGYFRMALQGYITQQRSDGIYVAPLIPQLFYGVDGSQLQTWRQYVGTAGQHTILTRSGGQPTVPREELNWRKLPQRGTGGGRTRRYGQPLTDEERAVRHFGETAATSNIGTVILLALLVMLFSGK